MLSKHSTGGVFSVGRGSVEGARGPTGAVPAFRQGYDPRYGPAKLATKKATYLRGSRSACDGAKGGAHARKEARHAGFELWRSDAVPARRETCRVSAYALCVPRLRSPRSPS